MKTNNQNLHIKECKYCKKLFVPTGTLKLYCSFFCKDSVEYKKSTKLTLCKICNKPFPSLRGRKVCSIDCKTQLVKQTKDKYYKEKVVPTLKHKPKVTDEEKALKRKEYNDKYNNTEERKAYMKEYRKSEEVRKREKESGDRYRERNPFTAKNGHLKRNFGISVGYYEEMVKEQNNLCAICNEPETSVDKRNGKVKDLAVDHCHTTGKVRKLLCNRCNTTLGRVEESINILTNMINYITIHKEEE